MSAVMIISSLKKVRKNSNDSWMACCPSHEDRTQSLSIKELPDGTVLINCFAGCGANEIIEALGLEISELFPEDQLRRGKKNGVTRVPYRQGMALIERESVILLHIAKSLQRGEIIDHQLLTNTVNNISQGIRILNG